MLLDRVARADGGSTGDAVARILDLVRTMRFPRAATGREIKFDSKAETVTGDAEASKLLTREYRKPYVVPDTV